MMTIKQILFVDMRNFGTNMFVFRLNVHVIYQTSDLTLWSSYQIRKLAGYACTGNAGKVFPVTDFKGNR